jgi:hypothetical protein
MSTGAEQGHAHASWNGLPKKHYRETFGQYLRRITLEQEFAISQAARLIGVMPRSIFDSYIPPEPEPDRSASGEHAT